MAEGRLLEALVGPDAEGMRLDVYTLDGLKVKTVQAQNGQRTVISLADQPAGTYIVKTGDTTFKFLKR